MQVGDKVDYITPEGPLATWPATVVYVGFTDIDIKLDKFHNYGMYFLVDENNPAYTIRACPMHRLQRHK